ncbi:hypothetical protein K32_29650 [Kaistia sp. 32K]|uniref:hypothetical protein n=1 Tax=Kaistia sp. 32K TaxID=2795690 RepID=UPI0019153704|nr:hypothetical protein [Kaistia sp. 32K]BCP54348.1 hypothetical protein K32_29650 [Kaistia sp. 32K]
MSQSRPQNALRQPERNADPQGALPAVRGRDDAIRVCASIEATMEALLQMIEAETTLLRKGQAIAAAELEARQGHYARRYIDELGRIGAVGNELDHFLPGSVARLRRLHEQFCAVLRIDMAALATARAASAVAPPAMPPAAPARPIPAAPAPVIRDPRLARAAAG